MTALEKFQELPHINSLYEILDDWEYTPILYHLDGIDDDGTPYMEQVLEYNGKLYGDSLDDFSGSTPEEAIDKAYKWFHSKFSND